MYKTPKFYFVLQNFDGHEKDFLGIYEHDSSKRPQKQFAIPGIVRLEVFRVFMKRIRTFNSWEQKQTGLQCSITICCDFLTCYSCKGKTIPVQPWKGPEGSRRSGSHIS